MARLAKAALPLAVIVSSVFASKAAARNEEETIRVAHEVLGQFLDLSIRQIPDSLLAEAHGVAIIPDVIKLGFVLGGQHGRGVMVVREPNGSWRAPTFITITGGSIGWQAGAQSTDFLLVFKSQKSVDGLLRGKFTLGADAAVAAGPLGRRAGAATDTELKAEIYSYSRSRGLFAGVSLEGSALQVDDGANLSYYGPLSPGAPPPPVPPSALSLVQTIARLTNHVVVAPQPTAVPPSAAGPAPGWHAPGATPEHIEALRGRLAQAATELAPLLDDAWRQYLALPAEVYQPGGRPSARAVEVVLSRFNEVARNRQFQALTDRPQFHQVHQLLQALHEDLRAASVSSRPAAPPGLPPPPMSER
jgi:lipid-binding SYLF domain-containing protein